MKPRNQNPIMFAVGNGFVEKRGGGGIFPNVQSSIKRLCMYLERNSHHLFKGPSINNVIILYKLFTPLMSPSAL